MNNNELHKQQNPQNFSGSTINSDDLSGNKTSVATETIIMAYSRLDNEGFILDCDNEFSHIFSVPCAEIIGSNIGNLIDDKDFISIFGKVVDSGESAVIPALRISGVLPVVDFRVRLTRIQSGEGYSVIVLLEQSTLPNPEEEDHKFENKYFRMLTDNIRDVISMHNFEGDTLYVSPGVRDLIGLDPEYIVKVGTLSITCPDDIPNIVEALNRTRNSGKSEKTVFRLRHTNGNEIWVEGDFLVIDDNENVEPKILLISRNITKEKAIVEALSQSEEKYRKLLMSLPTGVALLDENGLLLEVNQGLLDIFNLHQKLPETTLPMLLEKYFAKDGFLHMLKECLETNTTLTRELSSSSGGKPLHVIISLVPFFMPESNSKFIIANIRNVTSEKEAEKALKQQFEFLNLAINTMQGPFFMKDENHRWVMLNDAAVEMMGHSRDYLLGKSDYDLFPKDQADVFWEKDNAVFEQGSNINEEKITWSNGEVRTIITAKNRYEDEDSGKKYIVGAIVDVTDFERNKEALARSESKYQQLFDSANDFIFSTDMQGNFTNVNKAMLKSAGITLEEFKKLSIFDMVPGEKVIEARKIHELILAGNVPESFELEMDIPGKDKTFVEIRLSILYQNNEPVGVQGIARNITERKLEKERLEKYNRDLSEMNAAKDKFYSIIAHDLRNPYNSLIGFSDLLLEDFDRLSKDELREYAEIINKTAKNSLNLLEKLLTWSRLQAGRMPFHPEPLNLSNEINAHLSVLTDIALSKQITIRNLVSEEIVVFADANMLLSILHNLLMNSIKFSHPGNSVQVSAQIHTTADESSLAFPCVKISVSDHGVGIPHSNINKLFDASFFISTPGTYNENGTGLGLLLSKEMIEKHKGKIWVESTEGKGSEFFFTLPLFVSE